MEEKYKRFVVEFTEAARDNMFASYSRGEKAFRRDINHKCGSAFTHMACASWYNKEDIKFCLNPSEKINFDTPNLTVTFIASQDALDLRKRRCHPWPDKLEEVFIRDRLNEYLGSLSEKPVIYVRNVRPE